MLIEETKQNARRIFDQWFPIFAQEDENGNRERLFEYFHSGYLAGTKHRPLTEDGSKGCNPSLVIDDVNRDLDL